MTQISIVMPYKNAAATLTEAVQSIIRQTFDDYELIAINDHSIDESSDIMSSWQDSRFRLFDNPGEGLVDALNFGISKARSEWIARMDADDIMHTSKLELQWSWIQQNPSTDVVSCQTALFPEDEISDGFLEYVRWQNRIVHHEDFINQCYVEMPLTNPTAIFRSSMIREIGGYRKGNIPEDYDFWLRALHAGYRFAKIPRVLFNWRDSKQRYTRTSPACTREAFDNLRADFLSRDPRMLQQRPIVYCGAGRKTRRRARLMIERGFTPHVWVDIDPRKIGNKLDGIPVVAPDWIIENRHLKPLMLIYIASHGARDELEHWLQEHGFRPGEDFLGVG